MTLNPGRNSQGSFYIPAKDKSLLNGSPRESKLSSPVSDTEALAVEVNQPDISLVVGLFKPGGPSAVFGAIWSVVIDAINRMFWGRPQSHVSQKVWERVTPPVAHRNASGSVLMPRFVGHVLATGFQVNPAFVLRRGSAGSRHVPVNQARLGSTEKLFSQAATGSGLAWPSHNNGVAAVTLGQPVYLPWLSNVVEPNSHQSALAFARFVPAIHVNSILYRGGREKYVN